MKFKTVYEDIEFIVTLEQELDYKEIHKYSQLDIDEDDAVDDYIPHSVLIKASYQDLEQTFYLYGVFIHKETDDIAEELAEILDEQNIFDQVAKELEMIELLANKKRPHWAK